MKISIETIRKSIGECKSSIADFNMRRKGIYAASDRTGISPEQMKVLFGAQQGEEDAVLMYKKLADKVTDEADRKAFLRLADDEARHSSVFYKYTGKKLRANPAKSIVVPLLYKTLGREKAYPIIAKGEYDAAEKYKHIIADYPEVEEVMNDETHHGDAVMGLLKK